MISSVRSMEGGVGTNVASTAGAAPREIPFRLLFRTSLSYLRQFSMPGFQK
jgi:hypothetical protein